MTYIVSSNDDTIQWGLTGAERIVQNVLNIIRTKKYEVPFMRGLGIDPDCIDNTLEYIRSLIAEEVTEIIDSYEPRAKVVSVNVESADDNGNLIISVELEV